MELCADCATVRAVSQIILIVEDEPSIAENIEYSLETEGFKPIVCPTGKEGLAAFKQDSPDLIVLDVGLPDITGFDLCREIRKTSQIPIIFLTAREGEIDRVVGLELGADDYMVKPFSPRELAARVRAVLRRVSAAPEPAAAGTEANASRSKAIAVDDMRMQIRYQGESLTLTRYEFGLLRLFATHPGRVFTRDQLMDQVWEEPEASLDRTVDAHIKTLRAKLREINDAVDPIVTHRGVGYSLREDLEA
ncbi:MAG: two-component system catabolic regulation response regulator CreB [Verrucomicrobiales bacterium]|jgi:two-component system catabolic regulation response regulator CreB